MSVALIFNPQKLPRTMTRAEWRAAYSWLRSVQTKLKQQLQRDIENVMIFGDTRIAENIVNPLVCFFPDA